MAGRLLLIIIFFFACSRPAVAPSIEPPHVAVEVAHVGANGIHVSPGALIAVDPAARSAVIYVVNGDRAIRRSVATGGMVGNEIEIVSGVAAGEEVVTRGGDQLRDGDRVLTVSRR
ncbi:MAG TPA: hypothetical protein VGK04_10080 [Thermoanaerobaculia bacterium]